MRSESEMRLTLERLRLEFGVDISDAVALSGQPLADWLDRAEEALFRSLLRNDA